MRRLFLPIIIAVIGLCAYCLSMQQARSPVRLLFVGNSLTYVGNLPAVLDALATSNGSPLQSDMIVKGGAALAERVADGSVERALAAKHYDYVVLQERGGDVICAFGPASCKDAEASLAALARIVAAHGAKPILLGTYQSVPQVSAELVGAESAVAARQSVAYVSVSDRFQAAIRSIPSAQWLHADGAHPGHDLVLLEAALLYRQLFGPLPGAVGLTVHAPMYEPNTVFSAPAPTSHSISVGDAVPLHAYTADRVAGVLAIASGGSR
jgi:hypothetical protein